MMAFEPAKSWKTAWVTGPDEDKVAIIDLVNWEQIGTIDVPGEPHGLVYSPDGKKAYIVQRKLNQVAILYTASQKIAKTAPVGKRPDMIAISPDGKNLYVTSRDDNKLLMLSAADLSVKAEVATGDEPHDVAYRKQPEVDGKGANGERHFEKKSILCPLSRHQRSV
jgi:YVTN family beta-propeller protein